MIDTDKIVKYVPVPTDIIPFPEDIPSKEVILSAIPRPVDIPQFQNEVANMSVGDRIQFGATLICAAATVVAVAVAVPVLISMAISLQAMKPPVPP